MFRIALKMLIGDSAKYFGLVSGVAFATLLMSHQISLFTGIMKRSAGAIHDVPTADIWVMDTRVLYVEEVEPMRDIELIRVRSVPGVEWATPFYKGSAVVRTEEGYSHQVQLIGVDKDSLVGLCPTEFAGDLKVITQPQTAILDKAGYEFIWPGEAIKLNKKVELNDNRLVVRAVCRAGATFQSFPVMYVSYDEAMRFTLSGRKNMSFILVKAAAGLNPEELARLISQQTKLQALTKDQFTWRSIKYMLTRTGIPINFGMMVLLAVIIGAAITAQTFYLFISENLRQFAVMKAVGVTNRQLLRVVWVQAIVVGISGYGLGIGCTALFFSLTSHLNVFRGLGLPWQVMLGSAVMVTIIIAFSISFSLKRLFTLDPAIVFRG